MPNKLTDVRVEEISLVRRAANRRKFLLLKEDNVEELIELLKLDLENEAAVAEELAKAGLSAKAAGAVKGALRLLSAYKDELPKDIMDTLARLAGYGYASPEEKEEDVAKAEVPDWVKRKFAELEKSAEAAKEALAKEIAERKAREYLAKAQSLDNIPGEPKELAEVLMKADAAGLGEVLGKLLESINTSMTAMYKQIGSDSATPGNGVLDEVHKQAQALLEKSQEVKTMEQAIAKVLALQPELYQRYLEETR